MILSHQELQSKLGIKHDSKMRRWLSERCIPFTEDGKGKCITTMEAFNGFMLSSHKEEWALETSPPQ